jgi:putative aminopeptidase FrvX
MGYAPGRTRKGAVVVTLPGRAGDAPRAVTAHVDTLGAIVKEIKASGRLVFDRIGGYPYFAVNGEHCWVKTGSYRKRTMGADRRHPRRKSSGRRTVGQ